MAIDWRVSPVSMEQTQKGNTMSAEAQPRTRMNDAQRDALWNICGRYNVPFREDDYTLHPKDACMMAGYAEGWVGGKPFNTIFVGVSPDGCISS